MSLLQVFAGSLQVPVQLRQDIKYKVQLTAHCELFLQLDETKANAPADKVLHEEHLLGCEQLWTEDGSVRQREQWPLCYLFPLESYKRPEIRLQKGCHIWK